MLSKDKLWPSFPGLHRGDDGATPQTDYYDFLDLLGQLKDLEHFEWNYTAALHGAPGFLHELHGDCGKLISAIAQCCQNLSIVNFCMLADAPEVLEFLVRRDKETGTDYEAYTVLY